MSKTIIPAYPGFALVLCSQNDAWVEGPIIAWKIEDEGLVWPITEEIAVGENTQAWAIQRPDGSINIPGTAAFDNLTLFRESFKANGGE